MEGWQGTLAAAGALYGLAAAVRLLFLWGTIDRDLPFSIFYYGDSRLYREFALAILRGESFDQGIPFHPPLLAYLLAGIISFTGENPAALRGALALIGALTAPLTYVLGARLWGHTTGIVAGLMAAFSFGLCVASVSPNTEAVYIPILIGQALALIALGDRIPRDAVAPAGRGTSSGSRAFLGRAAIGMALASGLLAGLGALTRAEHLGFLVLLPAALAIGWPQAGARRLAGATAIMLAAAAAVIAPWTVHNYLAISRFNAENPTLAEPLPSFVLVSNYGALNFALANNAGSDGGFKPDLIVGDTGGASLDLRDPRHLDLYLHGYRTGLAFLASDPAGAIRLAIRKLAISLDALSLGFGPGDRPAGLTGTRRAVDVFTPDAKGLAPVALVLTIAGAWISRALWRRAGILWLIMGHKILIALAFFGYARLFVQVLPFVFLLHAAAIVAAAAWITRPAVRRGAAAAGILACALLLLELVIGASRPRNFRAEGSADPATGKLLQDTAIRLSPAASRGARSE